MTVAYKEADFVIKRKLDCLFYFVIIVILLIKFNKKRLF